LILELLAAYNEEKITTPKTEGDSYSTKGTLAAWCERLTTSADKIESLTDATAGEINRVMQSMNNENRSKTTVRNYQYALRSFYRYHDQLDVDPSDIAAYEPEGNGFDSEDTLTRDEIQQVKDACSNARDNLIFHLLMYTGMRNTAVRTLRVKDVDVEKGSSGRYRVNPDADGLKGASDHGEWRPLLGAAGAIREWLKYHPDPQPENYLVTAQPNWPRVDPTEPVTRETIRHVMEQLKEESGIDKPMHPHMMRHNFVTICKRDYDMDNDTIKWLIHHAPDSRVMETTYRHLSDQDWSQKAEVAAGHSEPEQESTLTPMSCESCGESLGPEAKACPSCGEVFAPDAKSTQRQLQQDIGATKAMSGDEITEEQLDKIAQDDALLAKLIEKRSE